MICSRLCQDPRDLRPSLVPPSRPASHAPLRLEDSARGPNARGVTQQALLPTAGAGERPRNCRRPPICATGLPTRTLPSPVAHRPPSAQLGADPCSRVLHARLPLPLHRVPGHVDRPPLGSLRIPPRASLPLQLPPAFSLSPPARLTGPPTRPRLRQRLAETILEADRWTARRLTAAGGELSDRWHLADPPRSATSRSRRLPRRIPAVEMSGLPSRCQR